MAFTTNLSGTAQVDDSLIAAFDKQFLIAQAQVQVMEQFVQTKTEIGATSIKLTKYSQMPLATTPLTETDDVVSQAMADVGIILTPAEYGLAITKTKLASLQSGGKVDVAAAQLNGLNMGRSQDKLALLAMDASTNVLTSNGGAENTIAAGDVMTVAFLNKLYGKLSRASIAPLPDGTYAAALHDDCIGDLRNSSGAGSWLDVLKYARPEEVLKNEVGMIAGFRIVKDNHATISVGAGAGGTINVYNNYFMGMNALGKAVSDEPHGVITGPFDKLARFVNVGWTGVFKYGIVDQDACWLGQSASSVNGT